MLIQKGSTGVLVTKWQQFLVGLGYHIDVDAGFGDATETATKDFQSKNGLAIDGKVGDATWAFTVAPIKTKPVVLPSESHLAVFDGSHVEQINEAALARVAPQLQTRVKAFIAAAAADGVVLQIVQGLRTFAEQDAIYAQGRTRAGAIVTHARGGASHHNYGLACDLAPVVNGNVSWEEKLYATYGKWADIAGLSSGSRWTKFKDLPHVELESIPTTATLLDWYRKGGLASVWSHFN